MLIWTLSTLTDIWTVSTLRNTANYHHGNLRNELILSALKLLDEKGIEGVGIRQVAREAGVAHSAPANHFKNKQALYTALAIEVVSGLLPKLQRKVESSCGIDVAIHGLCQSLLDFALMHPNRYSLLWRKDCVDSDDPDLTAVMESLYTLLLDVCNAQAAEKRLDVESLAIAVWSMLHGYVSLRLDGNLAQGFDALTGADRSKAVVDVMLKGLL
ncbi:MAG: TetR/AcrR family transcriptional regulator [Saccharospirillaceae bacterium]|nr:TetR/AcrR family transcriptional regulator [Saccharospirillaceae bacterium]